MNCHRRSLIIFGGVAVGLLAAGALYKIVTRFWGVDKKTAKHLVKKWEPVGHVSALHIYPVKSGHRVEVDEADCDILGMKSGSFLRDRCFLVVNENNNFLHARIHPSMVLIESKIQNDSLELKAPNMTPIKLIIPSRGNTLIVRVWGDEVPAIDCGDEVAVWLSQYIFQKDSGARLVYYPQNRTSREAKTKAVFPWMKKSDGAAFHDLAPYLVLSEGSVVDLNSRLDENGKVSILNFRPNISISGCSPYEEDTWTFIKVGETATFRLMKRCDRCVHTTINPETGVKHPEAEPIRTLRKYRLAQDDATRKVTGESPFMGVNFAAEVPGHIRVGDIVYAGRF